ncbi:serine hydrolase [Sandaracinomonas limnophila]|uniref:beta-N-acetylhexosaminidase n=1 Tax=Sandaracinomonas limnophila TaxID=1862386 RepID=A0A437PPM0_9BACT|nr:glycoside hydrolase family 3 N-terminal domain-containing protein [Sandaracinomonas limnophila]RVU24235.1 serine hydrolase [Sandaracinomonas limnophila]
MKTKAIILLFGIFCAIQTQAQQTLFPHQNQKWVDSVLSKLSLEQKIGQVLMPRANFNATYDTTRLYSIVKDYHIGGLVFFAGNPTQQALLVNKLQSFAKVPMFIGMDLEWGLNMRLDSTVRYPYQMTLGAIQGDDALIEKMGYQIAQQCKRMGIHINYAPVVDINNNPNNPVINFRSFGENRDLVTQKSLAYMRGLQKGGIITSAKHFPGHGDTSTDSHLDLPTIEHKRPRLDSLELFPYRALIENGLQGIMVGHLNLPALDSTAQLASTLSKPIVTGLLRNNLHFGGLVFTDAMDMKGATKNFPEGTANVKAFLAGNDILETFTDVPAAFNAIKKALDNKEISVEELDHRVGRILNAKVWAGLDHYQPIQMANLVPELNPIAAENLNKLLAEKSITLLKNPAGLLPLQKLDTLKIATLAIGKPNYGNKFPTAFQQTAENYMAMDHFVLDETSSDSLILATEKNLKKYNVVLMGIHGISIRPTNNYSLKPQVKSLVDRFVNAKTVAIHFANPMTLTKFDSLHKAAALVTAYQEGIPQMEVVAEAIFGGTAFQGKFPVTLNNQYKFGQGFITNSLGRLKYQRSPEEVGINRLYLSKNIDSLANLALKEKATPGIVVLVAKEGKVIFHKAYGKQTYESTENLSKSAIYDLASITKISTSVPALMKWQDEGKFKLTEGWSELVPTLKNSNKSDLKYLDILTHQAKLKAWIPFWMDYIDSLDMIVHSKKFQAKYAKQSFGMNVWEKYISKNAGENHIKEWIAKQPKLWDECVDIKNEITRWKPQTLSYAQSEEYPVAVSPTLWAHKSIKDKIFTAIKDSPLREKKEYVYSDLSYYLLPGISPQMTGKSWEDFLKKTFYAPLGASTLTYQAEKHFPLAQIVPTEYDSLFRKTLIHGKVHDEGAALLDGISGHAGLFGNANDLAKLMQMYLQKGYYGGTQFIDPSTLNYWISYPFSKEENSRRGVGFDKPDRKKPGISAAASATEQSFGHSGFTGTYTWVDPVHDLVYVFMSNRVYPTRNNSKLSDLNIRTGINEVIYQAINKGL